MLRNILLQVTFCLLCTVAYAQSNTLYTVFGGGSFCQGSTGNQILLDSSDVGIDYELVLNDTQSVVSGVYGTGDTISFGHYAGNGNYTVVAHDTTTLQTDTMNGVVTVTMILRPMVYNISGGGSVCVGQMGPAISLSNSQNSIVYDLLLNDTLLVSSYSGAGSGLFLGNFTQNGTYTVRGRKTTLPNCPTMMNGYAIINVYPLPDIFPLQGNGLLCSGSLGAVLHLDSTQLGIQYSIENTQGNILTNGMGTGDTLYFNPIAVSGTYLAKATRTNVTGCNSTMAGTITISTLNQTVYTISGGGVFCEGSAGGTITLSGSQNGFEYYLSNPLIDPVPSPQPGNGGALTFDSITSAGDYGLWSRYLQSPFCEVAMAGSASLIYQPLPSEFPLSGGGFYCEGQAGAEITLEGSQQETTYKLLLNHLLPTGAAQIGTGNSLLFSPVSLTGTYSILAEINSCQRSFADSVTVEVTDCTGIEDTNTETAYTRQGNRLVFQFSQAEITVIDMGGREVLKAKNTPELNLELLQQGVYLVQADDLRMKFIQF